MKNNKPYLLLSLLFVLFLVACSVKKDKLINRKYHALTTEYNILYHGNIALDEGLLDLNTSVDDNYWDILPIEKTIEIPEVKTDKPKETPFRLAQDKATKAIQKHSMYIGQKERNPRMDEAYLLLAKSRFYEGNFIPALEALNFILYKYPSSSKIETVKIWREKVNIKLDNNEAAILNLNELIGRTKLTDEERAQANLYLSQAHLNLNQQDSALFAIKKAIPLIKDKPTKARYTFIKGQIYEQLSFNDSAYSAFQEVIDFKRNAPLVINAQAHAKQASHFDYENGDTLVYLEKMNKLIKNREYRPHLDVLYHQKAIFYDKQNKDDTAIKSYNKSLKHKKHDVYLVASNYRNIAEIYFRNNKYEKASFYYDSTLVNLEERTREHRYISKKRLSLDDVIKYEKIANEKDSILQLVKMSDTERITYFEQHISKLKAQEEERLKMQQADLNKQINAKQNGPTAFSQNTVSFDSKPNTDLSSISKSFSSVSDAKAKAKGSSGNNGFTQSGFYFYNPVAVSKGKQDFQRYWGKIKLVDNWNSSNAFSSENTEDDLDGDEGESKDLEKNEEVNPKYLVDTYIKEIPTDQGVIDTLNINKNFAYYQLGLLYSDNFNEYQIAVEKLELLLANNPEERLILPSLYHLYKTYKFIDQVKSDQYKQKIIAQYPESRYASILQNASAQNSLSEPEQVYAAHYAQLESGELRNLIPELDESILQFVGDEIAPKLSLLKANVIARVHGVDGYKKELSFVALNYPSKSEGKEAESLLKDVVPALEALKFNNDAEQPHKIVFPNKTPNTNKKLIESIENYLKNRNNALLKQSEDLYSLKENMIVIHGFDNKAEADMALSILRDYKDYLIKDKAYTISANDYKVIQVQKSWDNWIKNN